MLFAMQSDVQKYLSHIGRQGGRRSRRTLTPEQARNIVLLQEARRAYKLLHAQRFRSFDPHHVITMKDIPWVASRLKEFGGRRGWEWGAKLCPSLPSDNLSLSSWRRSIVPMRSFNHDPPAK